MFRALMIVLLVSSGCAAKRAANHPVDPSVYEVPSQPEVPTTSDTRPERRSPRSDLPAGPRSTMQGWSPELRSAVERAEARADVDFHVLGQPGELRPKQAERIVLGPPDPALVVRFLPTIAGVLGQYPVDFRRRLVPNVLLVGKLQASGTPFLGLAHPREGRFDLAIRSGSTDGKLSATLHHELGHLVFADPRVDKEAFKAISGDTYVGLKPDQKWGRAKAVEWLEAGFISRYASKNAHEDFAELAQVAFTRPDVARRFHHRFARIGLKLEFLTGAYRKVAPEMVLPWIGEGWEAWRKAHPPKQAR